MNFNPVPTVTPLLVSIAFAKIMEKKRRGREDKAGGHRSSGRPGRYSIPNPVFEETNNIPRQARFIHVKWGNIRSPKAQSFTTS